jgi:hypothetical protein
LNVGQTLDNPVDYLKTPAKPPRVSPNPNAMSDHTLDPIMIVGSGLLEGLSREGLPRSARGWFYDLIGWTVGRSSKSRVLRPDWLQLFFQNRVDELVRSSDLGHVCVRGWLNWPKIKGPKTVLLLAPHTMHASCRHDHWHVCMPTRVVPSRSESSRRITN